MKIAVVGLGSVGRRHARNLRVLGEDDLVLVRTGLGQAGPLDESLADLPTTPSLAAAVAAGAQAVVVANPTSLHADTALEAVRAGCHVLVEKPIAHTADAAGGLASEVAGLAATVLVGYQLRFHPVLEHIRHLVADGAIGDLVTITAHWGEYLPGWHPTEDHLRGYSARADLGGGVLLTLSHPIDYLRWIAGEIEGASGFATRTAGLTVDVEDAAALSLRFASGAVGTVTLDYAQRPPAHALLLVGARGGIRWDGLTGEAIVETAERRETIPVPEGFERNSMFLDEMRHFLACCDGRETPRCTVFDGVRAVEIALSAADAR